MKTKKEKKNAEWGEHNDAGRAGQNAKTKTTKKSGFNFKQLLFGYLAVTKVLYWINAIAYLDNFGEFGIMFLNRLISQDIMVILILTAMHFLERYIFNGKNDNDLMANVKHYTIGLVIFIALITGYNFLLMPFVDFYIDNWFTFFLNQVIVYSIIAVFLHIKSNLKQKEAKQYIPDADTEAGKISLLTALRDAGVLTQEEFETKSLQVHGG